MQYKKGTFIIIPNKEQLKGFPSEMQTIYMWLCNYADENGQCFPSRNRLAKESGCNVRTVDKYLKILIENGFISKDNRGVKGSKQKLSNLYTLLLVDQDIPMNLIYPERSVAEVRGQVKPYVQKGATVEQEILLPSVENNAVTQSNELTHLTILPIGRGETATKRLLSIYRDCFKYVYGFGYKPMFARDYKIFKDLLESYTELQIARMLTIFFSWRGMDGVDDREHNYYTKATFPLTLFKATLSKYEAYIRNILQEDFDNDEELLVNVGKYITNLK